LHSNRHIAPEAFCHLGDVQQAFSSFLARVNW
jgi:hypothetical protein